MEGYTQNLCNIRDLVNSIVERVKTPEDVFNTRVMLDLSRAFDKCDNVVVEKVQQTQERFYRTLEEASASGIVSFLNDSVITDKKRHRFQKMQNNMKRIQETLNNACALLEKPTDDLEAIDLVFWMRDTIKAIENIKQLELELFGNIPVNRLTPEERVQEMEETMERVKKARKLNDDE